MPNKFDRDEWEDATAERLIEAARSHNWTEAERVAQAIRLEQAAREVQARGETEEALL